MFLSPPQPFETGHDSQQVNKKEQERVGEVTTNAQMTYQMFLFGFWSNNFKNF